MAISQMKGPSVVRAIKIGFLACLLIAVLAFGGAERFSFALIQAGTLALCLLALWVSDSVSIRRLPWKASALLCVFLGVQWLALAGSGFDSSWGRLALLTYLLLFLAAVHWTRRERDQIRLVWILVGLGVAEALYGLVQYLTGWQKIFTYSKVYYLDRASGTYINPNHFAGLLEMLLPLSFALVLYRLDSLRRGSLGRRPEGEGRSQLGFLLFASILLYIGIIFSQSRMGILSVTTSLTGMVLLWASAGWQRRRAILAFVVLVAITGGVGLWIGLEPVAERYESIESASAVRFGIWRDTVNLIREHWLWGTGWGTFVTTYTTVQSQSLTRIVDHAHNDYLEIAAELGLPGAVLVFGLILVVLYRLIVGFRGSSEGRQRFLALGCCGSILALLFHSLADFNLYIPANAMMFSVVLGLGYLISEDLTARRDEALVTETKTVRQSAEQEKA